MVAPTLLLLQTVQQSISNSVQALQHKRTESTSSYEQSREVPMYSTSCCGDITAPREIAYCNIIPPSPQDLYCRTFYIAPVQTLIPSEVVEDMTVYGTLDSVEEVK